MPDSALVRGGLTLIAMNMAAPAPAADLERGRPLNGLLAVIVPNRANQAGSKCNSRGCAWKKDGLDLPGTAKNFTQPLLLVQVNVGLLCIRHRVFKGAAAPGDLFEFDTVENGNRRRRAARHWFRAPVLPPHRSLLQQIEGERAFAPEFGRIAKLFVVAEDDNGSPLFAPHLVGFDAH